MSAPPLDLIETVVANLPVRDCQTAFVPMLHGVIFNGEMLYSLVLCSASDIDDTDEPAVVRAMAAQVATHVPLAGYALLKPIVLAPNTTLTDQVASLLEHFPTENWFSDDPVRDTVVYIPRAEWADYFSRAPSPF